MRRLSFDRSVPIIALRDYLLTQYENFTPAEVMRHLQIIAQQFPALSVSRRLAEQFRARINEDWRAGILTRYTLIIHAFPILYESAVNLVETRRLLALIMARPIMRQRFAAPTQMLPNL